MPRALLTWSDRSPHTPTDRAVDRGPVMRLLDHTPDTYSHVRVLTTPTGEASAKALELDLRRVGLTTELRVLAVDDPTDHRQIFASLDGVTKGMPSVPLDVCLSAGTPQMQTLWVILVEAGLLRARMLQVIPATFVPSIHPTPVREVYLDIDGFPEIRALQEEVVRLRATRTPAMIGDSPAMQELRDRIERVSRSNVPVLVEGETGTGKELAASAIHRASARRDRPFVAENCGAFSDGVLASELFGHEKGAFTGAQSRRRGLFEQADGGTLFLDEVAEMSPRVQVMLLRVLQEGKIRRVGAERELSVDVRVIAATHRDLRAMVERGEFREDLYYRIAGAQLRVPALRERASDIEALVRFFLDELPGPRPFPNAAAWACLRAFEWPGNIRQLRAEVVRWTVFCDEVVTVDDLSTELKNATTPTATALPVAQPTLQPLADAVAALERDYIRNALDRAGSLSGAARLLNIDRNTLKRKLHRYSIATELRGPSRA